MEQAAPSVQHEFWRPAVQSALSPQITAAAPTYIDACHSCGTEFMVGARFCHVCGGLREPAITSASKKIAHWFDIQRLSNLLEMSLGSMIALFVGMACALAAVLTGLIYTANTVLDWQAIQLWRIEWMLASIACFVAGILLRKPRK
ncbi:MAG TPA: hypothetical protein VK473_06970 [Terriglobales bacterium]|nr:hypothetical protein [Terriglobales bacterium]